MFKIRRPNEHPGCTITLHNARTQSPHREQIGTLYFQVIPDEITRLLDSTAGRVPIQALDLYSVSTEISFFPAIGHCQRDPFAVRVKWSIPFPTKSKVLELPSAVDMDAACAWCMWYEPSRISPARSSCSGITHQQIFARDTRFREKRSRVKHVWSPPTTTRLPNSPSLPKQERKVSSSYSLIATMRVTQIEISGWQVRSLSA